jgi:ribose-phosphate pyrophosphokinase
VIKLNGLSVPVTKFPDNTHQVWQLPPAAFLPIGYGHTIQWDYENDAEIFQIVQLVDLVRAMSKMQEINLSLPYFPYGRQDKPVRNNATFGKRSFVRILNLCQFTRIYTWDIHSKEGNPHNLVNTLPHLHGLQDAIQPRTILFPDKGSFDRYDYLVEANGTLRVAALKERDPSTGKIFELTLPGIDQVEPPVLMIDDICDGGATFVELSSMLQKFGIKKDDIHLFVTHGIFSKGTEYMFKSYFGRIFTLKGEVTNESSVMYRCL